MTLLQAIKSNVIDAYSLKYLNKSLDSHQISAMADLALLEDLSMVIRFFATAGKFSWKVTSG